MISSLPHLLSFDNFRKIFCKVFNISKLEFLNHTIFNFVLGDFVWNFFVKTFDELFRLFRAIVNLFHIEFMAELTKYSNIIHFYRNFTFCFSSRRRSFLVALSQKSPKAIIFCQTRNF